MSAQKIQKGLAYLVFIPMLWVIANCSSDSSPANEETVSSSSEVADLSSSDLASSSSSIVVTSSSSEVAGSSSSGVVGSSSSVTTGSSSSTTDSQVCSEYQTSFCGGLAYGSVPSNSTTAPTTGNCLYIGDFEQIQPNQNSTVVINGLEISLGGTWDGADSTIVKEGNKKPAPIDGGYYVYVKAGTINSYQNNGWKGIVAKAKPNCGSSSSSSVATATSSSSRATSSSSSPATGAVSSSSVASTPITTRSWTNVDYAATAPTANRHDRQRLDLKLPNDGNGPFPLILYVHGGGFVGGNWQLASNQNGLIKSAPDKGYAVASAGYLLYQNNKASFPQMVEDILAAIRHLRANASTYHLDPNKFVIAGYSAGGYLTNIVCALSGTTHTYDVTTLGNAGVSSDVQAAASSAGLTDFSKLVEQSGSTIHNTMAGGPLGGNLTDNTELMKNNLQKQNPLNWVSTNTPPLYMRHGTGDGTVPWQQSQILFDKITSVTPNAESLGKVKFYKHSGGHDDFASGSDTPDILTFLDKALGIQR